MGPDLPLIDEFETSVNAGPAAAFDAVSRAMARTFEGSGGRLFTRLLGCAYRGSTYTVPPSEGQEVNGFRVMRVDAPRQLILEGRHRFAAYRLTYDIDEPVPGSCRVRARTDAAFPGMKGGLYRTFVITSGAHAFIVQRMLQRIARKAERSGRIGSTRTDQERRA